ncbi:MAG TPA: fibronectin type III domain-containing protein [Chitinophagaceae bacterium]
MKKPKIVIGFDVFTDAGFENLAQSIYASMFDNPYFLTPLPALTEINAAVTAYSDALKASTQTRGKNEIAIKNQARQTLSDLLGQLANSVMATANGDRAQLVSTNFPMGKDGEASSLSKPENLQVTDGLNPGELVVKVTAVKGAKGYVHQYTPDPLTAESEWKQEFSTSCKYILKNLDPAKKYWCRVAVIGSYNQLVYSDAISRVVQ